MAICLQRQTPVNPALGTASHAEEMWEEVTVYKEMGGQETSQGFSLWTDAYRAFSCGVAHKRRQAGTVQDVQRLLSAGACTPAN